MSESAGDKTFAPTAKRKRDAAARGDVLRSRDLAALATIAVGAAWLRWAGPWLFAAMGESLRLGLRWDRSALAGFAPERRLAALALLAAPPVAVLGLAAAASGLVSQLALGRGGGFVAGNLAPRASRLNPVAGLGRMFGANGWIELGKGLLKAGLLGAIAWWWASANLAILLTLGAADLAGQLAFAWRALTGLLFALTAGLLLIALADFPVQWVRRQQRLRMSHQDLRDEHKEQDGSPEQRAARRGRQRKLAMSGVAGAMRQAQFVVTNPSHFAVALAYDPGQAIAPTVVARGRGDKALAMRDLAAELALPVLEYPALARSLYFTTRERQVIREELYAAVATVLAFVMSLKRGERREAPVLDVPVTLRFDAEGRLEATAGA